MKIKKIDILIINWLNKSFQPLARLSIFIIFFWFGALKLFEQSPATPLAHEFINQTLGAVHFGWSFKALAVYECLIAVLFLFPKLTRIVIPLLLIHMVVVCLPLFIVTDLAWQSFLVPTLEGQYIIKNLAIIALAIGVAAQTKPFSAKR